MAEYPSAFSVSALASGTVGAAALGVAELVGAASAEVDQRLASAWFLSTLRPIGWERPPMWDPLAGDYETRTGWIKLHTNAPHHRAAALRALGCDPSTVDRAVVGDAARAWDATELESAVLAAGGCAAVMRTIEEWRAHPQGAAVATEPLVHWQPSAEEGPPARTIASGARPLAGTRVLDLTRVLAGPVATRWLAGLGADVLRVDPPDWSEPGVEMEVTLGKRCAHLDLRRSADRDTLRALLRAADVVVHGYRPGALDALGLDAATRRALRPGLVDVSLDAYGHTGPWRGRRGFDSLVQMSSGIAAEGARRRGLDHPVPLPVQALDHAAGYVLATAVLRGLAEQRRHGRGVEARTSLARVAHLLTTLPDGSFDAAGVTLGDADFLEPVEATSWGPAHRLRPPARIDGVALRWDRPAVSLGSHPPAW